MLNWGISKKEMALLVKVCERVEALRPHTFERRGLVMDLNACHSNGCPLDFAAMLEVPEFDLLHDIYGINRHLDRSSGKLLDFFSPRCSRN